MPDINVEEYYKRQSEQERELEKLITKEEHLNEEVDDLITRIRSLEKQVWGAGALDLKLPADKASTPPAAPFALPN